MLKVVVVLATMVVAATMTTASASALSRDARITTAGLGPIKIGMTERQVERAAKRRITRQVGGSGPGCTTARVGNKLYALFTGRLLARIYVGNRRYMTRSGIRVGDSERKVYKTYPGEIVTSPHKYVQGGHYLKILDGNRKVVFETDGREVTEISTGRKPEIDYVEGCS